MALSAALLLGCAVCSAPQPGADTSSAADGDVTMIATADVRVGGTTLGHADSALGVVERRVEGRFGVALVRDVVVSLGMPVLFRSFDLRGERSFATVAGDLGLSADVTLLDVGTTVRHRLWLSPAMKFPTAPVETSPAGEILPSGLQPGCSAIAPDVEVVYVVGDSVVAGRFGGGLGLHVSIREAPHRGTDANLFAEVEVHPAPAVVLRVGTRWLFSTTGEDSTGNGERDSGGALGYATLGVDVTAADAFTVSASLEVPAIRALVGEQAPTPIGALTMSGRWDVGASASSIGRAELASNQGRVATN